MSEARLIDTNRLRSNNLDFLRFLFAALVILSHSFPLTGRKALDPFHGVLGGYSVHGFFIISGFLITRSWISSASNGDYFLRRVLRIYPGFIVACLFCLFVVAPLGSDSWKTFVAAVHPATFLLRMALLQQPIVASAFRQTEWPGLLSGSMWTIPHEFLCYILVAVGGSIGLFSRRRWMLGVTLLLFVYNIWLFMHPYTPRRLQQIEWNYIAGMQFLALFGIGACCWLYRERIPRAPWLTAIAIALMILSVVVPNTMQFVQPFSEAYLIFAFAFAPKPNLNNFAKQGDLSYGLYLYAWPTQMLLARWFGAYMNPFTLFPSAFVVTTGLAWLSCHGVERPALKFKRRQPGSAREGQATA